MRKRFSKPELKQRLGLLRKDPTGMSMWEPHDRYDRVDIACGQDADSILELARVNPDKRYLGMDPELKTATMQQALRLNNLHLIRASAEEVLPRMRDGSIGLATMDCFLYDMRPDEEERFFRHLKQKLDGPVHIRELKFTHKISKALLEKHGFEVSEPVEDDRSHGPLSADLKLNVKLQKNLRKMSPEEREMRLKMVFELKSLPTAHLMDPEVLTPMFMSAKLKK